MRSLQRAVPDWLRSSLSRKLLVIVLVAFLAIGSAGIYTLGEVSAATEETVDKKLSTVAEQEADATAAWLEDHQRTTRLLSQQDSLTGTYTSMPLDEELSKLPEETHAVHIVSLGSHTYEHSSVDGRAGARFDLAKYDWTVGSLESSDASQTIVSEVYRQDDETYIAFLSRIEGTERAVVTTVETDAVANQFSSPVEGSVVEVVSGFGRVEMSQNASAETNEYRNGFASEAIVEATNGGAGVTEIGSDLVAYHPVEGTGWVMLVHAPVGAAYGVVSIVRNLLFVLIGVSLLGLTVVGLAIGRPSVNAFTDLEERADDLAAGDLDVDLSTDRIDEAGALYGSFATMRDEVRERREEAAERNREIQTHLDASERRTEQLNARAAEYSAVMQDAAEGDLTARMEPCGDHESMAEVAEAYNGMMDQLETTMARVDRFAAEVARTSGTVAQNSEQVSRASRQVTESTVTISEETTEQESQLEEISGEISNLSATIEEVAASTDELSMQSAEANEEATRTREASTEALSELDRMTDVTAETGEVVEELRDELEAVEEIVDVIDDIAEQTNLLALNASIEAARAGEAGEGFAVVASEVKSLATEAGERTAEIAETIDRIRTVSDDVHANVTHLEDAVENGADTIEEGIRSIEGVADTVEDLDAGVQSIDDTTDVQAESVQEVASLGDSAALISRDTSEQAEEVAAAAEEQTASLTEVNDEVEALSERAEKLAELVDGFEMDADGSTEGTTAVGPTNAADPSTADDTPESATPASLGSTATSDD